MKKLLLLVCILFVFGEARDTAFALEKKLSFGIKGGVNLSHLRVDILDEKSTMVFGLNAGVFSRYHLVDRLYAQFDAAFSQKGDDFNIAGYDYLGEYYDSKVKINYLDLTPSVAFQIPTQRSDLKFFLTVGLQLSFFLNGEYERNVYIGDDISGDYNKSDINSPENGFAASLETVYNRYVFTVRYYASAQRYHKEINARFRVLSFLIGYSL